MTRDQSASDRVQGIEFGALEPKLANLEFPISTDELLTHCGEHEIGHPGGSARLNEVFKPHEEETYESVEDVRDVAVTLVGDDAIGRKNYADRDPPRGKESRSGDVRTL